VLLPFPVCDEELRHGYTISRINGLAVFACRYAKTSDSDQLAERAHVARAAIADMIYLSKVEPNPGDLIRVGWRAVSAYVESEWQSRGYTRRTETGGYRLNSGFLRYWQTSGAPTRSPEEPIVERLAMSQIMKQLRPLHRQVLQALAEHDDYGLAAEALGKPRKTFTTQVADARKAFLELWHEGEEPSRPWGRDRRRVPGSKESRASATYVISRRRHTQQTRDRAPGSATVLNRGTSVAGR
jgi:hypothetical protein